MITFTCILIEDELHTREELKYLLEPYECIEIIGEAADGISGYELIKQLKPDLVFLDISMPGMSGIELASRMVFLNKEPKVIFTTAHREYALNAFDLGAFDYLLKPYEASRIQKMIQKLIQSEGSKSTESKVDKLAEPKSHKLAVQSRDKVILIDLKSILYCSSENEKVKVVSTLGEFESTMTLSEIAEKTTLFRIHRGILVNLDYAQELYPWFNGTYQLVLRDDQRTTLTVSRSYVKQLKDQFI